MKKRTKISERNQNLLATLIKIYSFNITYAIKRAQELTGESETTLRSYYYGHLRKTRRLFTLNILGMELVNVCRLNTNQIQELGLSNLVEGRMIETELNILENEPA